MCIRKQANWKRQRKKLPRILEDKTGLPSDLCEIIYMYCEYNCRCIGCVLTRFSRKRRHHRKNIVWTPRGWDIDERNCIYHGISNKRIRI
jgi:hypothetical protein